jgi:uncharacterized spore protein YtfJ
VTRVGGMTNTAEKNTAEKSIVEKIAETITSALGTKINYGEKITLGTTEAVPVSLVTFGFGGGSGGDGTEDSTGEMMGTGGGGGGASVPLGMYVEGANGPRFVPNLIPLMIVSIPLTFIAGKALAGIIRALKK